MTARQEGTSEREAYVLSRDGKELFRGTQDECIKRRDYIQGVRACFDWGNWEYYEIKPRKGIA